ncbi:LytTR family DNA-binding domain-containing protein [Aureispira sp. CCB-QB1]|uniref:LytR/AlgR family response regulator transcription factor n=1 Tax=Aureispira sp. CCB-QB1 TaxID=1313421 RepID=UPI0006963BE9|nr:LytTR family DNA-binding domain-containing protein [Aureispira sp. CCB-QB1]
MKVITCVIVEDEVNTRKLLKSMLEDYCDGVKVLAEAGNVQEGVEMIKKHQPQLVFLDIAMPKESGFSLYKYFDEINFKVIFTTAFSQYAIQALKLAALDYLMKPINLEELMESLDRFRNQVHPLPTTKENYSLVDKNAQTPNHQKIALACSDGYIFVPIDNIIRCQSDKSYTLFIIKDQEPIWTSRNLGEYTTILEEYNFKRVHRSHIINPKYVKKFIRGKSPILIMDDDTQITISSAKRDSLLEHFFIP